MSYVGGNPASYKGLAASWEKGRQLKQLGTNSYKYNSSGIRIGKTVNGVEHKYTVEGINILREEYGEHVLDYLYGVDGDIIGFTYDGTAYYYEKNLQGDVIGLTDASGNEITQYTYDAWGKVLFVEGNTEIGNINPIRYRSYYYDSETQFYYLNSRYYDPETGRFINSDDASYLNTVDSINTFNIFVYCGNNPISFSDYTGFAREDGSYNGLKYYCEGAGLHVPINYRLFSKDFCYNFATYIQKQKNGKLSVLKLAQELFAHGMLFLLGTILTIISIALIFKAFGAIKLLNAIKKAKKLLTAIEALIVGGLTSAALMETALVALLGVAAYKLISSAAVADVNLNKEDSKLRVAIYNIIWTVLPPYKKYK